MSSRRTFLMGAGSALAVNQTARKVSANDKIRVAVLGVNGRGKDHIKGFQSQPDAEVAILCDPDRNIADERALEFFDKYGKTVKVEQTIPLGLYLVIAELMAYVYRLKEGAK